jgi:hypothetical protein
VAKYVEKLEQPDPRIAAAGFREKARGVGHVIKWLGIAGLLILLGVALVLWQQKRQEAAPVAAAPSVVFPKVPGLDQGAQANGSGTDEAVKVVVDYTIFQTVEVSESVSVITGWHYPSNRSTVPDHQYCHVRRRTAEAEYNIVHIKAMGVGENSYETTKTVFKQKLPDLNYENTMAKCRWFSG